MSTAKQVFTVNFHGLGEPWPHVQPDEARFWCPEDEFKRLLDVIVEFRARPEQKTDIKITFDDGNRSDLSIGVPALVERGLDATFFVCSGRLENPAYLGPEDLRRMEACGMSIGCHGATHIPLRGLDDTSLKAETVDAGSRLSGVLGRGVSTFAIPFGSYDRRVMNAVRSFDEVHTSDARTSRPGARIVTRHSYVSGWSAQDFEKKLGDLPSGPKEWLGQAKLLVKRLRP